MPEQVTFERLGELRDKTLRYIRVCGSGKPKAEVPIADLRSHLEATDTEYHALYLILHADGLTRTDRQNTHIGLTPTGRGLVDRLFDSASA